MPRSNLTVLGFDPGFASVGWAVLHVEDGLPNCVDAGVFRSSRDGSMAKNVDTLQRIERLTKFCREVMRLHAPHIIGCEAMSWTRFANADRAVAFFWGVLGATSKVPIVQTTPSDIKRMVTGKKSAPKEEVIEKACDAIPGLRERLDKIRAKTQRNHAADAAVAALASLESETGKLARVMYDA